MYVSKRARLSYVVSSVAHISWKLSFYNSYLKKMNKMANQDLPIMSCALGMAVLFLRVVLHEKLTMDSRPCCR